MDISAPVFATTGLLAAGVLKGATGIGYASCALPFLVISVGLRPAIALVVLPAIASNVALLFTAGRVRETVRNFWPLYASILPGVVSGLYALRFADQAVTTKVLGALIVAYAIQSLIRPTFRLASEIATSIQIPIGLVNGFFTGLTGSQVMPLMPYMLSLSLDKGQFVQAVNLAVITSSVFLGSGLIAFGVMTINMLALSVLAIIPALAGVQLGNWCRAHIDERRFRTVVIVALLGIGVMLISR